MISILDLKVGNITSLGNCLNYLGLKYKVVSTSQEVRKSRILVIPGVGSFDYAMDTVIKKNLKKSILDHALKKKKLTLGICIGMQILFENSQEGKRNGLGIFQGKISKLKNFKNFKVPHVGFSSVSIKKKVGIFNQIEDGASFYFTNSYGLKFDKSNQFENYCYTKHKFDFFGTVQKKNVVGLQFHPELSHTSGLTILKNFFDQEKK